MITRNLLQETYELEKASVCIELQRQIDNCTQFIELTPNTEQNQSLLEYATKKRAAYIMLCAQINGLMFIEELES